MSDFLLHVPRAVCESAIQYEASLEAYTEHGARTSLLLDLERGRVRKLRTYAKKWGWSWGRLCHEWRSITRDVWGWCSNGGAEPDSPLARRYLELMPAASKRSYVPSQAEPLLSHPRATAEPKHGDSEPVSHTPEPLPSHSRATAEPVGSKGFDSEQISQGSEPSAGGAQNDRKVPLSSPPDGFSPHPSSLTPPIIPPKEESALRARAREGQADLFGHSDGSPAAQHPPQATVVIPFETFWDAYDKKVGRRSCERLWGRIPARDRPGIIEHVKRYVQAQPLKRYRKNPSTYLNQRAWEDEIIDRNEQDSAATNTRRRVDPRKDHAGAYARFARLEAEAKARGSGLVEPAWE